MLSATGLVRTLARGPLRLQLTPGYVNQVTLVGNVGSITGTAPPTGDKDAEGSEGGEEGKSSKPVRISLAVDRPQSRAALAAKEKKSTQWFNVVIFKPSLQRFALNNFEKGYVSLSSLILPLSSLILPILMSCPVPLQFSAHFCSSPIFFLFSFFFFFLNSTSSMIS